MYQALSIIVSIITLAIASSSTLFITRNNKNISSIRSKSDNMDKQILANNELTKAQIIAMIKKINENDTKIVGQHKDIRENLKKVEYESKLRTENVDSSLKSFRNITNANVIGMTDTMRTNNEIINKRADTIKKSLDDYKIFNKSELDTINTNHSLLSSSHKDLMADYGLFQSQTNTQLKNNYDYSTSLYNSNLNLINQKISGIFLDSKTLDKSSKDLIKQIGENTDSRIDNLMNAYKQADFGIQNDINTRDTFYKNTFVDKNNLESEINKLYFDSKPQYNNMNTLIAQTETNKNSINTINTNITDNANKIKDIQNEYLRMVDIPQKINQVMPSTDIFKEVEKSKKDITDIDSKMNMNVDSIKKNNDELKRMLQSINGGLSGEITLKDLNDRIAKNTERIEANAVKTKLEILQSLNKDNSDLQIKINENTSDIKNKVTNSQDDFNRAFNNYVSSDTILNKVSNNNLKARDVSADNLTLSRELVVNGVKFSDVVKKTMGLDNNGVFPQTVPMYEKDFQSSGPFIQPNKAMKFKEGVNIGMDDANMSMRYGTMNLSRTAVNWANDDSVFNFNDQGANFNDTTVRFNKFDNIKDNNNKGLGSFIEDKINAYKKEDNKIPEQVRAEINGKHLYPMAVTSPSMFIGDESGKINVKEEINKLKDNVEAYSKTLGIQQNNTFYNKNNKDDLYKDIKNDMHLKINEYLPRSINVDSVGSKTISADEIILSGNSLEKIKMNSKNNTQSITDFLDARYETKGAASDALGELTKIKPIIDIQLTDNNIIQVNRSDGKGWTSMGQVKIDDMGSITKIALDKENNRLLLTNTKGQLDIVDLPIPSMDQYAKTTDVASMYAPISKDDTGIVYLNEIKQKRLDDIVGDDIIKNLKQKNIPTIDELNNMQTTIDKNVAEISSLKDSTGKSIKTIALDEERNRFMLTTDTGLTNVSLPDYSTKIKTELKMEQYPTKEFVSNAYAPIVKNGSEDVVVYLNRAKQERLDDIVGDDKIKNMKQMNIATTGQLNNMQATIDNNAKEISSLKESTNKSIKNIALDEEGNKFILRTDTGLTNVSLPDYITKIKKEYPTKEFVSNTYAPIVKNGSDNVIYLNSENQARLNEIVGDDKIKDLKKLKIATSTELENINQRIESNTNNITGITKEIEQTKQSLDGLIKAQITRTNLNAQTNNSNNVEHFIRLNDKVSLKAEGIRLKMCTGFDIKQNLPTDCHDLWTTRDLTATSKLDIKK